jgi:predicted alpha/beta superfamily hydrolase
MQRVCRLILAGLLFSGLACTSTADLKSWRALAQNPAETELLDLLESGHDADARFAALLAGTNAPALPMVRADRVLFVFKKTAGNEEPVKIILADRFNTALESLVLQPVPGSSLAWGELRHPDPDGLRYRIAVGKRMARRDPLNPLIFPAANPESLVLRPDSPLPRLLLFPGFQAASGEPPVVRRDITVWLPPGYAEAPGRRYPVFYMLDGQNLWEGPGVAWGGWKMDSIAAGLIGKECIEPLIIVGISSVATPRIEEYAGFADLSPAFKNHLGLKKSDPEIKATAAAFDGFLLKAVKPFIDTRFRTKPGREHTAIGGASGGGMYAIHAGFSLPQVFSRVAALSGGMDPYVYSMEKEFKPGTDLKIYLDCGTADIDAQLIVATRQLDVFLRKNGFVEGKNYFYKIFEKAPHNEKAWAERVPLFLEFLFPAQK